MVHPLITLYSETEQTFDTNGLGSLNEAASCVITEEANGEFELELTYPITGRRYADIQNRRIIFAKPNPVDPPQAFRIYEISRPINSLISVYASHISYDLSGYPVNSFTAENCSAALQGLKTNSLVSHPFTFWTDKDTVANFAVGAPVPIRNALGGVEGSILDIYGGEYKFDNFEVRLYNNRGADRGVYIRYGKNLTDLQQEEKCSKVYSAVLPYWQDYETEDVMTLSDKIVHVEGVNNLTNILVLDCSQDFDEKPTEDQLRTRATNYIKNNDIGKPTVSLDISFEPFEQTDEYSSLALLERVELFDTVNVEFPQMGISSTSKVKKTVYNVITGRYDSVTLGDVRSTLSDTIIGQDDVITQTVDGAINKSQSQLKSDLDELENRVKVDLEKAVNDATNWITNGKGYMVAIKNEVDEWIEICSLDNKDIAKAVNIWRWNNAGFGHSSHGYNGPYETAITQDGHIVATFITTGTLDATQVNVINLNASNITTGTMSANRIKTGKVESNNGTVYFDLDKNELCCSRLVSAEKTTSSNNQTVAQIGHEVGQTGQNNSLRIFSMPSPDNAVSISSGNIIAYSAYKLLTHNGQISLISDVVGSIRIASSYDRPYGNSIIDLYPSVGDIRLTASGANGDVNMSCRRLYVNGTFRAVGEKNRVVNTKNYGKRLLYAYETSTPMFCDIGEGITDDEGLCYIFIDDVFSETVDLSIEYQVFLQAEGMGNVWVEEKAELYFVVKGTPNLRFAWRLDAIQRDYSFYRLETDDSSYDDLNRDNSMLDMFAGLEDKLIEEAEESEKEILKEADEQLSFIFSIPDGFEEFISEQEDILRRF